jgi:hypothetical protein
LPCRYRPICRAKRTSIAFEASEQAAEEAGECRHDRRDVPADLASESVADNLRQRAVNLAIAVARCFDEKAALVAAEVVNGEDQIANEQPVTLGKIKLVMFESTSHVHPPCVDVLFRGETKSFQPHPSHWLHP